MNNMAQIVLNVIPVYADIISNRNHYDVLRKINSYFFLPKASRHNGGRPNFSDLVLRLRYALDATLAARKRLLACRDAKHLRR